MNIHKTYSKLCQLLEKEKASFMLSHKIQNDWLQSIKAQLEIYTDTDKNSRNSIHRLSFEDPAPNNHSTLSLQSNVQNEDIEDDIETLNLQTHTNTNCIYGNNENTPPVENQTNEIISKNRNKDIQSNEDDSESSFHNLPMSGNRSATSPCFSNSSIRFVDDNCLIDSSDSSSDDDFTNDDSVPIPFTVSGSMSELTQSASTFRERWMEMIHQKKAATNVPKKPFRFAFEDEEVKEPEAYAISDDSDEEPEDDEEIYERNPVEIHGKMIPAWARGELLLKQLKRQQRIDPDSIFSGFTADIPMEEVFNSHKPRWDNRSDSGWWDADRVTEEEVAKFKAALGLQ